MAPVGGRGGAPLVAAAFILLNLFSLGHAATYTVGDAAGWSPGTDFTAWAASHQFFPGDILVFNYDSGLHSVQQVSASDYTACNPGNSIKSYTTGSDSITITQDSYFICGTAGHCNQGMHLAIKMSDAPSSPITTTPVISTSYSPPPPHLYQYNSSPRVIVGMVFTTILLVAPFLVL